MHPQIASLKEKRSYSAVQYLILYGFVIALPLLLMLGALLFQSVLLERDRLQQRILQVLGAVTDNLDRDLDRDLTILQTLATSSALQREDWPAFYEQAKASLQGKAYLILLDASGRQIINTYVPYGQAPPLTGDPETVRRIVESKRPFVSDLFTSLVVKKPVFNVSLPILRDGRLRFIMSLGLLPEDLVSLLAAQNLDPQWVLTIWDSHDMIMARSSDNERFVGVKLPEDLRADPKGSPVINTRDLDGTEVLHAVTRSQVSGWGVGVSVPVAFLEQQLRRSLWLLVAMSAVAVILAVVLGALFARQLTAPLAAASAAAVALGRGHPLKISSSRLKEANTVTQALVSAQGDLSRRTSELRESEARKSAILESALDAIIAMDRDGTIVDFNPAAEQLFGFARDRVLGKPLADTIIPERLREAHRRGLQSFLETGQGSVLGRRVEVPALRADGTEFEAELAISTTHLTDGQILFTGCLRDVTERKRAAQAEEMLVHELHHRTNNLLAVVQAIAKRSLSGSDSLNEAKAAFEARLQALAQAHRQLGKSNWTGVSFGEIVRESLEPFAAQTAIDGPNVIVGSQDAQNFTLAVHELATNAVKHGALSRATGTVDISWDVSADGIGPVLTFKWQERGGPPVATPERRGFGTGLLRASFPEISLDYAPDGLVCEIKVPLRKAELPLLPATAERSSRITPYARTL